MDQNLKSCSMDYMMSKKKGKNYKKKRSDSSLKVVYISSPMKVKTSAAKFRSIVQKLTGRDSDISNYMLDGNRNIAMPDFEILPETFIGSTDHQPNYYNSSPSGDIHNDNTDHHRFPLMDINRTSRESPTSSDSLLEQTTTTTTTTTSSTSSFPYGGELFMNSYQIGEHQQYLNHQDFFPPNLFGDSYNLDIDVLGSYDAL